MRMASFRLGNFPIFNFKLLVETLRLGDDNTRQEQETDQVRDGHQAVKDIR